MAAKNVNLHILKASGRLEKYSDIIEIVFNSSIERIASFMPISDIDVVVLDAPGLEIPEKGIGGYSPNSHSLFVYVNPDSLHIPDNLESGLKSTLAHEIHHCMRWRDPGYGDTLLQALVSEGLADHFDLEINGGDAQPWSQALDDSQLESMLEQAKLEFNSKEYNHQDWFFGNKDKIIPRWTGYSLGFKLVGDYLEKHPDKKASKLYNARAEDFINSN